MISYKIKCFATDTDNSANYADYVIKGEKGWKICGKAVEKPHIFNSFSEADKVRSKLGDAFKCKAYFLLEVQLNG